jgi:hypothetical protein
MRAALGELGWHREREVIDIERVAGGMVRCKKSSSEGVRGWEGSSGAVGVGWCGSRSPEGLLGGSEAPPVGRR